jgi:murein L,D-transpeptidase YafK
MRYLIILLFSLTLFADVFDTYRYNGIDKTVQLLEKNLQSKEFWLERIKNKDVKYGYFEKPTFILFCNKLDKSLKILKYKDGKINNIKTFTNLIVGKLGDKEKEGDLRTPIGNYRLINRLIPGNTFYGPLAFVTSYPNLFDKVHKKNGYGIWIHGKPLDGERGDLSKGCIVLNNDEILYLDKLINYKNSILEITQNPIFAKKEDIAEILATIYKWRDAWRKSDLEKYISFYDKDFKRSNGMNLKEFKEYKKRVFRSKRNQKIKIFFKNIQITPYQNLKNIPIYKVEMYEEYLSPTYTFKGNKEVYFQKKDGKFRIIIEK